MSRVTPKRSTARRTSNKNKQKCSCEINVTTTTNATKWNNSKEYALFERCCLENLLKLKSCCDYFFYISALTIKAVSTSLWLQPLTPGNFYTCLHKSATGAWSVKWNCLIETLQPTTSKTKKNKTNTYSFFYTPSWHAYSILPASCLLFINVIVAFAVAKTTDDIKLMSDRQF